MNPSSQQEWFCRHGKTAQWIKALATKHDNLSLILRTHTVKGKDWLLKLVSDLHMHAVARVCLYTQTNAIQIFWKRIFVLLFPQEKKPCYKNEQLSQTRCGMVAHAFNTSNWEAEESRSLWIQGQSSLHRVFQDSQGYVETLSQPPLSPQKSDYHKSIKYKALVSMVVNAYNPPLGKDR